VRARTFLETYNEGLEDLLIPAESGPSCEQRAQQRGGRGGGGGGAGLSTPTHPSSAAAAAAAPSAPGSGLARAPPRAARAAGRVAAAARPS